MFKFVVLAVCMTVSLAELQIRSLKLTEDGIHAWYRIEEHAIKRRGLSCPATGSNLSPTEQAEYLKAHNDFRAQEGQGLAPLTWDDSLAALAQVFIDSKPDCQLNPDNPHEYYVR